MSNLSEEEIIEKFKKCEVADFLENDDVTTMDWVKDGILDIIKKQQKEIEELKKDKKALVNNYNNVLGNFISKDKIREKIKELESIYKQEVNQKYNGNYYQQLKYAIQVLQELLGDE